MLTYIFTFLMFVIPTGILAARNNRDWVLWSALSLAGGFAVFIVLALLRYLCPHCKEAFAVGSPDGVHCGHCGKRDRMNREDHARLDVIRSTLSSRGMTISAKGIKFTVHEQLGRTWQLLGMDELETFAHGVSSSTAARK